MNNAKKALALVLAMIMLVCFAACGGETGGNTDSQPTPATTGGEEVKANDTTITMAYTQAWDSLMPYYSASGSMITRDVNSLIYDRIALVTNGGTVVKPRAAKSWEMSSDGLTTTFHLNENAKWHDGQPVTSADWVWTFELVTDPASRAVSIAADPMKDIAGTDEAGYRTTGETFGVKAVDDYTFTITFKNVTDPDEFLAAYNRDIAVLPKHLLEGKAIATLLDDPFWTAPVGSGPCIFDSQPQIGQEMFLKANRDYQFPVTGFGTLKLTIVDSSNTVQAEVNGDIDLVGMGSGVSKSNAEIYEGYGNKTVKNDNGTGFTEVILNNQSLSDVNLRLAMYYGIDREKACQVATEGLGYVVDSYVLPFSDYCNTSLKRTRDVEKAKEYLAKSSYKGEEIELAVGASRTDMAAQFQQDLAEVGINIKIVNVEVATMFSGLIDQKYDMGISGHTGSANPMWFAYTTLASQYGRTYYSVTDPTYEELANKVYACTDKSSKKKAMDEFQEYIFNNVPWIPLWYSNTISMVSPTVENVDYRCGSFCNENVWEWVKAED
ncbi:MAG: peptide ABC transporter substrate-binding protein [Firmicutes bacterium]|nr:peptide ABC transporter substrate-binding protein [Bacillota bacterium]